MTLLLLACAPPETDSAAGEPVDTADTGSVDEGPEPAPLAELSSGECPALEASGTSSFLSSGAERSVTVIVPSQPVADMPLFFFFHGLDDPGATEHPGESWASALDVQALADETGTVWVFADSPVQNMYGYEFYLWNLETTGNLDLVLYDDLRSCVANNLDVDLSHASAMGFSGGALFTTLLLAHRADTLATVVQLSGGADLSVPTFEELLALYAEPATDLPVLLTTGGEADVWPSEQLRVVDFYAASDTLQGHLLDDGHYVVRCNDEKGHMVNRADWDLGVSWLLAHSFGGDSPFATSGLNDDADWCAEASIVDE
ncbi:MAG: hypothetical protein FJ090_04540 [Deltaproteobacteria bacterium]|nr:hypothetical protein [Deltaproteobacteria bacterium]